MEPGNYFEENPGISKIVLTLAWLRVVTALKRENEGGGLVNFEGASY
jgi:hypothetical protein